MGNFYIIFNKEEKIPSNTMTIAIKLDILLITIFSTHQIRQKITIG